MSDPDEPAGSDVEFVECDNCHASPQEAHSRVYLGGRVTSHTEDCVTHAIEMINGEDGARRVREQDKWAKRNFPPAYERLRAAAEALPHGDTEAAPFVAALLQLAVAQASTTGFVVLEKWVDVLDAHFPPEHPEPKPH
ncbi:hypothetical protein WKI65_32720 [Streptomyces sp. MS1.AVA.3]|uniref:hypothetical protein n=1 Tax=Streptomyces decoyicus TaxID=249567 RepID=UPI0030BE0A71